MKILSHGVYPLAVNRNSQLLSFKKGNFYLCDLQNPEFTVQLTEMPYYQHGILSQSRFVERALRNCPGPSIALGVTGFLYHYKSSIYRIDLAEKKVYEELRLPQPKKVLYFTKRTCAYTGQENIYFGEYFENKFKEPVNVWQRDGNGQWEIYSTFPAGSIEHVHNIAIDASRKRLLILTGDFGESCGIWSLDHHGQLPLRIVGGSQMHRAAWMYVDETRLLYATDTPFEQNHLIEIILDNPDLTLHKLQPIKGSSIYGGVYQDGAVYFSTSVEPVELTGNRWVDIFQRKRGPGIIDNRSYLYRYIIATGSLEILFSDEKDLLPMRLGQYGSFVLSDALTDVCRVLVYGLALKKYDDTLLELKFDTV
jgi:hypothetical protein